MAIFNSKLLNYQRVWLSHQQKHLFFVWISLRKMMPEMLLSNGIFSSCPAVCGFILIRRNVTYPAKNSVNEFTGLSCPP